MEKIYFDKTTFIWKTKLNLLNYKSNILIEASDIMDSNPSNITDAYSLESVILKYKNRELVKSKIDSITYMCLDACMEINTNKHNHILLGSWINVIRAKNPKQRELRTGKVKMHQHDIISKEAGQFIPDYTFVYYIQMPDNLSNGDGVLLIEGENKKVFNILPEEDDLIIMVGDLPHAPQAALNSTKDRIALAGNIKFEYNKKNKTLL